MIAVVILAAGESRRMGQPKALLPFPEKPAAQSSQAKTFLEHLIEVTRHSRAGTLRVVVGAHEREIRARVKLADECVVVNREWEKGQLSSLQAAIRSLPDSAEGMILCLVDHPLVSAKLIASLIEAFDNAKSKIVIPTFRGRRGHPVIFPKTIFAKLLSAPEDAGARAVVRAHASEIIEIPTDEEGVVLNLNDPATLDKILNHK